MSNPALTPDGMFREPELDSVGTSEHFKKEDRVRLNKSINHDMDMYNNYVHVHLLGPPNGNKNQSREHYWEGQQNVSHSEVLG